MAREVYIDVTEFQYWKGNFTGIQRVVYGLTSDITESMVNVRLVTFHQNQYKLLDQSLEDYIENGLVIHHIPTKEEVVKMKLRHTYSKLPAVVKLINKPTAHFLKKGSRWGLLRVRYVLHHYRIQKSKILNNDKKTIAPVATGFRREDIFKEGGYLLLPGTLWADNGHLRAAINAKKSGLDIGVVIYDLTPIYLPHTFGKGMLHSYTKYLFEVISVCDDVYPISSATASDIKKFIDETGISNKPNVHVIRLGDKLPVVLSSVQKKEATKKFKSIDGFMLCVGTIEARKNHILLYQALKLAKETKRFNDLPHLILVGKRGWLSSDVLHFLENDPAIREKVTIFDNLADDELAWLYEHALFTVYPSQYEGWGLPIAESLSYGTPVISSNTSSMPEIAPDLTEFISPYDAAQLLDAMIKLSDPTENKKIRTKISQNYKPTTWEETIKPIMKVINES